jgi:hypothetical protein
LGDHPHFVQLWVQPIEDRHWPKAKAPKYGWNRLCAAATSAAALTRRAWSAVTARQIYLVPLLSFFDLVANANSIKRRIASERDGLSG